MEQGQKYVAINLFDSNVVTVEDFTYKSMIDMDTNRIDSFLVVLGPNPLFGQPSQAFW